MNESTRRLRENWHDLHRALQHRFLQNLPPAYLKIFISIVQRSVDGVLLTSVHAMVDDTNSTVTQVLGCLDYLKESGVAHVTKTPDNLIRIITSNWSEPGADAPQVVRT